MLRVVDIIDVRDSRTMYCRYVFDVYSDKQRVTVPNITINYLNNAVLLYILDLINILSALHESSQKSM